MFMNSQYLLKKSKFLLDAFKSIHKKSVLFFLQIHQKVAIKFISRNIYRNLYQGI